MLVPYIGIEDIPNRFQFVTVVALRARQLHAGSPPRLHPASRQAARIAQQEGMAGLLEFTTPPRIPKT